MQRTNLELFLGVDAGGTKTTAVVCDAAGYFLGLGIGGPGHHLCVGITGLKQALTDALHDIGIKSPSFKAACYALAGLGINEQAPKLEQTLREFTSSEKVVLANDGVIALWGAFSGKPGVIAIAGTGSAVLARGYDGQLLRIGGWGHLLGDEGSAYRIAVDAIRIALQSYDGLRPSSSLLPRMLQFFGWNTARDAVRFFYADRVDKHIIARFAPAVLEEACNGDRLAKAIVRANARWLARAVRVMLDKTGLPPRIALIGGLFQSSYFTDIFTHYLRMLGIEPRSVDLPPAFSAAAWALESVGLLTSQAMANLRKAALSA
jgi:N-acetylglucosamine kinase